jgi:predicted DNA-binding transcriptional regulator YafY
MQAMSKERTRKPATRLLAMLELLQSQARMTGSELARDLQIDPRTVRRYIAMLIDMGMPIMAERGRDGAYRLARGYKLPPMMFTNDEAVALGMGLLAARQLGMVDSASAVASVQAKLERVMPDALQARLKAIDETVTLDIESQANAVNSTLFAKLSACAERQQRVHICYKDQAAQESRRDVDPYALAFYLGRWYVVGWCYARGDVRSFRLDRVLACEAIAASFARPKGFDVLSHLRHSIATIPRGHEVSVILDAPIDDVRARVFAELGTFESMEQGTRTRMQSQVDDLDWFSRELARLPYPFEIERPTVLRKALRLHAARLIEQLA